MFDNGSLLRRRKRFKSLLNKKNMKNGGSMKLNDTASEFEVSGENAANNELPFESNDDGGEFDENDESLLDDTTPPVYGNDDDEEDDMNSCNGHNDFCTGVNPCD